MPPCPKRGQPTADDDGWNYCANCEIRFRRVEDGKGFEFVCSVEGPLDIVRDWPHLGETAKWGGVRPEDSTVHMIDSTLPQFDGTRQQNLLVDMYMRWRQGQEPNFDYRANFDTGVAAMRFVDYLLNDWDRLGPILTNLS